MESKKGKYQCIRCANYEYCVEWEGITSECLSCENFETVNDEKYMEKREYQRPSIETATIEPELLVASISGDDYPIPGPNDPVNPGRWVKDSSSVWEE